MRRIDRLLEEYAECHQDPVNKRIHWVCVPLIVYSTVGLLWCIPVPWEGPSFLNWATITAGLLLPYYFALSLPIAFAMVTLVAACASLAATVDRLGSHVLLISSGAIFVTAWIGQFAGHSREKKAPSFLQDLQFLLIGPAWLLHFVLERTGIRY